jgi:hypothetical protein
MQIGGLTQMHAECKGRGCKDEVCTGHGRGHTVFHQRRAHDFSPEEGTRLEEMV